MKYYPLFLSNALSGEAGELSNLIKHFYPSKLNELSKEVLMDELGDILWYITRFASYFDFSLDDIIKFNINKINNRRQQNDDSISK